MLKEDDTFKYYYFNDDDEAIYIDADGVLSGSINDWRVLFTYTDPTSFTVGTVDNLGLEPITWTIPVSVEVGADVATLRSMVYLSLLVIRSLRLFILAVATARDDQFKHNIQLDDFYGSDNAYTITFTNTGTEDGVPALASPMPTNMTV